jgi:hypothetical protein
MILLLLLLLLFAGFFGGGYVGRDRFGYYQGSFGGVGLILLIVILLYVGHLLGR